MVFDVNGQASTSAPTDPAAPAASKYFSAPYKVVADVIDPAAYEADCHTIKDPTEFDQYNRIVTRKFRDDAINKVEANKELDDKTKADLEKEIKTKCTAPIPKPVLDNIGADDSKKQDLCKEYANRIFWCNNQIRDIGENPAKAAQGLKAGAGGTPPPTGKWFVDRKTD